MRVTMAIHHHRLERQRGAMRGGILLVLTLATLLAGLIALRQCQPGQRDAAIEAASVGDYKETARILDRILKANPRDLEAIYYRAICHNANRQADKALMHFSTLRSTPEYWELATYRSILCQLENNRLIEARSEVENPEPRFAQSALVQEAIGEYHMAQCQVAVNQVLKRLSTSIGDRPAERLNSYTKRITYADSKIYAASLDKYLDALENNHEFSERSQLTTVIDRAHRHLVAAVVAYRNAIRLEASDEHQSAVPRSHEGLADVFEVRGRFQEMESELKNVINTSPQRLANDVVRMRALDETIDTARLRLARSRLEADDFDAAIAFIEQHPLGKNGHRPYEFEKIYAEALAGSGKKSEALALADIWLRENPKLATMNFIRGAHHYELGEYEEAFSYLEIAVGNNYRDAKMAPLYVDCLLALKKYDRASAILDKILEIRSYDWRAFLMKIRAMEGMGWTEDARTAMSQALGGRFKKASSEGNLSIRAYFNAFLERYDLLPKDLHTARLLYLEDQSNLDFGRRYLRLLLDAGAVEQSNRLATRLYRLSKPSESWHFDVMMVTGDTFEKVNQHENATRCFKSAVKTRPYSAAAHLGVARNQLALGLAGSAWRTLRKVSAIAPNSTELLVLRFATLIMQNDDAAALEEANGLVASGYREVGFVRSVARLLINNGRKKDAAAALALIDRADIDSFDDEINFALLQLESGDERKSRRRLQHVLERPGFGMSRVIALSKSLVALGRHDMAAEFLEPHVQADAEIDPKAVALLARNYRALDQHAKFLTMLARLRRQGRSDLAFAWATVYCFERGDQDEVLSITQAAMDAQFDDPKMLEAGIRTALKKNNIAFARRLENRLVRGQKSAPGVAERLIALRLESEGKISEAIDVLKDVLTKNPTGNKVDTWRLLIDMLARHGQINTMTAVCTAAIRAKEAPTILAVHAAHHLVAAGDPNAMPAVEAALKLVPGSPDAWFDKAIVHLGMNDTTKALTAMRQSWTLRPDHRSTHGLALLTAAYGQPEALATLLKKRNGKYPIYVAATTPPMAKFIRLLVHGRPQQAVVQAQKIAYPSAAERRSFQDLLRSKLINQQTANLLRGKLPTFFIFASNAYTAKLATRVIKEIESALGAPSPQIQLMQARALMMSESTFDQGITMVSKILNASDMRDEAALSIYAQTYLANGQSKDMDRLIRFILEGRKFSDLFLRDMADLLFGVEKYQEAAKILYVCGDNSLDKTRAEARALFKAGHVKRAAKIIKTQQGDDQRDFLYCQIIGEYLGSLDGRNADAFDLLRDAVYRYDTEDKDIHLSLARAAYLQGEIAEARKQIYEFLDQDPSSAASIVETVAVIKSLPAPDQEILPILESRRLLLDPSGHFRKN